jgi:hypothetical protein
VARAVMTAHGDRMTASQCDIRRPISAKYPLRRPVVPSGPASTRLSPAPRTPTSCPTVYWRPAPLPLIGMTARSWRWPAHLDSLRRPMRDANSDETHIRTDGHKTGKLGRRMRCRPRIRQICARCRETPRGSLRMDSGATKLALITETRQITCTRSENLPHQLRPDTHRLTK